MPLTVIVLEQRRDSVPSGDGASSAAGRTGERGVVEQRVDATGGRARSRRCYRRGRSKLTYRLVKPRAAEAVVDLRRAGARVGVVAVGHPRLPRRSSPRGSRRCCRARVVGKRSVRALAVDLSRRSQPREHVAARDDVRPPSPARPGAFGSGLHGGAVVGCRRAESRTLQLQRLVTWSPHLQAPRGVGQRRSARRVRREAAVETRGAKVCTAPPN